MKRRDFMKFIGLSTVLAACGDEPDLKPCTSDLDCGIERECIDNICQDKEPEEVEEIPIHFDNGKIIYLDLEGERLNVFDVATKKNGVLESFPGIKSSRGYLMDFDEISASPDGSTLLLSYTIGTSSFGEPITPFYVVSRDGTNVVPITYTPRTSLEYGRETGDITPSPQLLSNNSSFLVLLGQYDYREDGMARHSHFFRFDGNTYTRLTTESNGFDYVSSFVVAPGDRIYFSANISGQNYLFGMDSNGGNINQISSLAEELVEMRWTYDGKIFGIEDVDGGSACLVDPSDGGLERIDGMGSVKKGTAVSPYHNEVVYDQSNSYSYISNLDSGEKVKIDRKNFPECNSPLDFSSAVWLK